MTQTQKLLAGLAAALAVASTAQAGLIATPVPGQTTVNLTSIYSPTSVPMYNGPTAINGTTFNNVAIANVTATTAGYVTFTYYGAEAGYDNLFLEGANGTTTQLFATGGNTGVGNFNTSGFFTSASYAVSAGTLAFAFEANSTGTPQTVANGANTITQANFGVQLSADSNTAYLFLNDSGGGSAMGVNPDWDYDDMIVSVNFTPVPEPATLALFALGLGLMGVAARRRQV